MREQALLALQGPRAAERWRTIAPGVASLSFMEGGAFPPLAGRCGSAVRAIPARTGLRFRSPANAAAELADALSADELVKPIGLGARDSLRLEAGLPLYGHDIDRTTTPVMAGLTFAIQKRRRAEGGFPGDLRIWPKSRMARH
jgi:aminomethyltransferase